MGSHTSHYPVIDPIIDPRQIMRQTNDWIARVGLAVMGLPPPFCDILGLRSFPQPDKVLGLSSHLPSFSVCLLVCEAQTSCAWRLGRGHHGCVLLLEIVIL